MAAKSLSTSTLSLKFMQNANRAKQLKEVELERAEVKDDGKWEVSQQVRDSWGVSKAAQSESTDIHESSYLPFLFPHTGGATSDIDNARISVKNPTGRRSFNKRGEEVPLEPSGSDSTSADLPPSSAAPLPSTGRKVHPRPMSISASGTSGQLRGFEEPAKPKKESRSARQAIFESGGVGTDLHAKTRPDKTGSSSASFMKPAGIDDPHDFRTPSTAVSSNPGAIINGARQKKVKRDREHEVFTDDMTDVGSKPKKRKKKKTPE